MLLEQERTKVIEIALKIQKEKLIPLRWKFQPEGSGDRVCVHHPQWNAL